MSGVIPFGGGIDYEYALPRMKTSGTLVFKDRTLQVEGWSWFDREWGRFGPSKWTWMDIQLRNGVQMSLWDQQGDNTNLKSYVGGKRAFVTLLYPDGSLAVAPVDVQELSSWYSSLSKQTYATSWSVNIPAKRTKLQVTLLANNQEIIDSEIGMPRIEGKCRVKGTYEGEAVEGDAVVEMFNLFPLFFQAYAGPPRP